MSPASDHGRRLCLWLGCAWLALGPVTGCRCKGEKEARQLGSSPTGGRDASVVGPSAEERALAASLRAPFLKFSQFRMRVSERNPTGDGLGDDPLGEIVFAWQRGVRWDRTYTGAPDGGYRLSLDASLTVWRWGSDEWTGMRLGELGRGKRNRTNSYNLAIEFLFDDFADRYELRRDQDKPETVVHAHARASTPGVFRHLILSLQPGTGRVRTVTLIRTRDGLIWHINLWPPEVLTGPPLPESCFTVQASPDDPNLPTSRCPTDRFQPWPW